MLADVQEGQHIPAPANRKVLLSALDRMKQLIEESEKLENVRYGKEIIGLISILSPRRRDPNNWHRLTLGDLGS